MKKSYLCKSFLIVFLIVLICGILIFLQNFNDNSASNSNDKYMLDVRTTDAFSAEAYLSLDNAVNDEYTIEYNITNLTSDELSVNLSYFFSLCYESNIVNPVAFCDIEEYSFSPNETKNFVFEVNNFLTGEDEDIKIISGSCVLEITNSDKYSYYNTLPIEAYIIKENNT